jgi:outer membrane protein OmpA-like peptidoglycan-associated protein/opacity protein-like surface antigen
MMKRVLSAALVASPAIAAAQPTTPAKPGKLDVSVAAGGHVFSTDVELGVADMDVEPGPVSSGLVGGRIGYAVMKRLAAEAEVVFIPTEDDVLGDAASVFGLRAHARFDLITGKLRPFVVAGAGVHILRGGSPQMDDDADKAYHWGGGVRYAITPRLDLRIDLRHLVVPDRTEGGATSDFEASAGVGFRFGGTKPAPKPIVVVAPPPPEPEPEPAPVDNDWDDDGFVNDVDKCADQAETKNGWQDSDGCPDEVITELAGIQFELNSATIDAASTALLDRAYEILSQNKPLRVEVSGHTSSEGNPDKNLDLSLRRAEAVKTYLVRRGIADDRILTVGHGADKPVADNKTDKGRIANRRIEFRILRPDESF